MTNPISTSPVKPAVLLLSPILIASVNAHLDEKFTVYRYFAEPDAASKEALLARVERDIEGVVTGGHAGVSRAIMARLPRLKVVAINGVGTDAVDKQYARERGIHVTATLGALTEDVADLAIGLLISACRDLCAGDRFVRSGEWARSGASVSEAFPLSRRFSGMRVGIVGLGRVGRAVAIRAAAFGCPIAYTDLHAMPGAPYRFIPDLRELAADSDALILAAAADKAEGIIDSAILNALGPRGFLVNIARGKLVNETDLVDALSKGRIAGAGLDVFVDEPHVPAPLLTMSHVALQPHRASATEETRTRMAEMVLDALEQGLSGRRPDSCVN